MPLTWCAEGASRRPHAVPCRTASMLHAVLASGVVHQRRQALGSARWFTPSMRGSLAPSVVQLPAIQSVQFGLCTPTVPICAPVSGAPRFDHGRRANCAAFAHASPTRAVRRLHAPASSPRRVCRPCVGACADNCEATFSLGSLSRMPSLAALAPAVFLSPPNSGRHLRPCLLAAAPALRSAVRAAARATSGTAIGRTRVRLLFPFTVHMCVAPPYRYSACLRSAARTPTLKARVAPTQPVSSRCSA